MTACRGKGPRLLAGELRTSRETMNTDTSVCIATGSGRIVRGAAATARLLFRSIVVFAFATCGWAAGIAPAQGPHKVTVDQNIFVPMRDGVGLATDVYFPDDIRDGPLPTVLIRTPYDKTHGIPPKLEVEFFASHGYAVAVQDVRGAHRSGGQ